MPKWLIIGISGVTCGGKTTLSHNLRDFFQSKKNAQIWRIPFTIGDVHLLSQDDYFLPVDDRRHEWIEKLNAINFELLTSLDMKQMLSDIKWTIKGRYLNGELITDNCDYMSELPMINSFENFCRLHQLFRSNVHYFDSMLPQQKQQQQQQQQQKQQHYLQTGHYYPNHHHHHQHSHHQQQNYKQQQQQPQQNQLQHHRRYQARQFHQQEQQQQQQLQHRHGCAPVNQQLMKHIDHRVNILIIEGFTIFNQPELLTLCNIKFHFHLPYEKCFERRKSRTYEPPDVTGYFEMCVWPYYERNFAEYRDRKDITFLNGEITKDRICEYVLQNITKYVEHRAEEQGMTTSTSLAVNAPPLLNKMIGIHNGTNSSPTMPCPMEQQ